MRTSLRKTIATFRDDSASANNSLFKAVLDDNIDNIGKALAQGANINSKLLAFDPLNPFVGFSPLMTAVKLGHLSSVKLLLKNHANVNVTTSSYVASSQTALDMAIDGILNTLKRVENNDFLTYQNIAVTLIESRASTSNKKNMLILQRLGFNLTISNQLGEESKNDSVNDPVEEKKQNHSPVTLQTPLMNGFTTSETIPPQEPDQSKSFMELEEISTTAATSSQMSSVYSSDGLYSSNSVSSSGAVDLSSVSSTHLKTETLTQIPARPQNAKLPMSSAYSSYGLCHHSNGRHLTARPTVNSNSGDSGLTGVSHK